MKNRTLALVAAALCAGCSCTCRQDAAVSAKSPDGRSEIRLLTNPLSYEVLRDGKVVSGRAEIGMTVDGAALVAGAAKVSSGSWSGRVESPVYKKSSVDLAANWAFADFGDWGVRLAARDDGVAYRFETKKPGRVRVDAEKACVVVPDGAARCWVNFTDRFGCEESVAEAMPAKDVRTDPKSKKKMAYLPFVYDAGGTTVAVTESDVYDYPIWNLVRPGDCGAAAFDAHFAGFPAARERAREGENWSKSVALERGGRWIRVKAHEGFLVDTDGARSFPWRVFVLADEPRALCSSDAVWALARPQAKGHDFSWVRPGKVAWDWWNCFDNRLTDAANGGCNTKTYERFIDFAAKAGVEYVIFDEGWSEKLDIWRFHPAVDVPHLISYANGKGVGIILWMAWAQVSGDEARVAKHFADLGAKGFKVDFMDRGDAECERFLWKFAEECRKNRMLVDYHGAHRPTGMSRAYPNVLNYEGVHGLECMKWFAGQYDFMANDVRAFFLRMTAGPLDYTPGAMLNYPVGGTYSGAKAGAFPGSVGTRCRQMAMMAMYEAPLQMLCDSPTNYEKNMECFAFMAATPVVWADTVGLGGSPDTFAAVARRARDGSWYAAAIADAKAREWTLDTSFLGKGDWQAEIFRDVPGSAGEPTRYAHESLAVKAGDKIPANMAPGGGFVAKFTSR
ncbi:MAG: glycoside hydrolase family 97 catalytic domain-containing protein [Kiritimatiellae bacterium]|nr:glycoside hydrolase family 97 catalytic domain-containing protein [Kiritimatiellia bacterium]